MELYCKYLFSFSLSLIVKIIEIFFIIIGLPYSFYQPYIILFYGMDTPWVLCCCCLFISLIEVQ